MCYPFQEIQTKYPVKGASHHYKFTNSFSIALILLKKEVETSRLLDIFLAKMVILEFESVITKCYLIML